MDCHEHGQAAVEVLAEAPAAQPDLAATWGDAATPIHLVFGLANRWLLRTHHGAVRCKHLAAYLDEFVFHFNRRTARCISHRFARLIGADRGHHLPRAHRPTRARLRLMDS
jgi:hypothetical protein